MTTAFRVLLIATFFANAAMAATDLSRCLNRAGRGEDPLRRDKGRIECLKSFAPRMDRTSCLRLTRGFEYANNAEAMKSFCTFELKRDPTASECMSAALSMDYGSLRDDLVWGCLQRLNLTISRRDCRRLSELMVFPHQKARASSYCENEIRSAR